MVIDSDLLFRPPCMPAGALSSSLHRFWLLLQICWMLVQLLHTRHRWCRRKISTVGRSLYILSSLVFFCSRISTAACFISFAFCTSSLSTVLMLVYERTKIAAFYLECYTAYCQSDCLYLLHLFERLFVFLSEASVTVFVYRPIYWQEFVRFRMERLQNVLLHLWITTRWLKN